MNILVLRFSSMGDCILAAAVFSFLRDRHPGASITFVTGSEYAPLFSDDPRLSAVVGIDNRAARLPEPLPAREWDLVADLQNSGRSRGLLKGVRTKTGIGRFDKQHWRRFMLLVFRIDLYDPRMHVAARYLKAAGGDPQSDGPRAAALFFSEKSRTRAGAALEARLGDGNRRRLALFPFSAWKNKEWPAERFEIVARHFLAAGWDVVIIGGPRDAARAEGMRVRIGSRCLALAGAVSLYECGCLMNRFDLALGGDTGLSHLARACGVKTGLLFGPTTRHFGFFPYGGAPFRVFEARLFCRPCHAHGGSACMRFNRACMKNIPAALVIAGLEELAGARPS